MFQVGDIVRWRNPRSETALRYQTGPYEVISTKIFGIEGLRMKVRHLNGAPLHFRVGLDIGWELHEYVSQEKFELDPFLSAARKAIAHAQKV